VARHALWLDPDRGAWGFSYQWDQGHITKGECNQHVTFTSPICDKYSLVKNWAHISYAWTLTSRGVACLVVLTVEHGLLHCVSFTNARDNCFCVTLTFMSELFSKVASRSIIDFVKQTRFFVKFKCNITCQSTIVFNYFSITNRF